jgi:Domain of unknown function (DUF4337)
MEAPEEHRSHDDHPLMIPVAVTLSILAVLVAIATLLGHRAASEEILLQTKASDQRAYFQEKNIRLHEMQIAADMLATLALADKEKAGAPREKYLQDAERYDKDKDQITEQATELEKERAVAGRPEHRFDSGEVILEIALIICSLTLLTKKKGLWLSGSALGVVGLVVTVSELFLH